MLADSHYSPMFGSCPEAVIESLGWYARRGRPVGGFLEAVIAGDLHMAVARADMINGRSLAAIVSYLHNEMPPKSYGSPDAYRNWLASGGLEGWSAPSTNKPKIYCFSNAGGGDGIAYAMAADGTVLGSHLCSHEAWVPFDLGVEPGSRPDRHETYRKHYPDGYEMEFVRAADIESHPGLTAAYERNQQRGKELEPEANDAR